MAVDFQLDGMVDIRMPIPGNSYEWGPDNIEPPAAKKRIVIHATASGAPGEDGFTMAAYHIGPPDNWPGIGVNFVITKDEYPGHAYDGGATPAGSQIQYVGDGGTIRAGVFNHNPGSLHIEISGLFTPGHGVPSENQLRNTRKLIDFLIADNNIFPSLNFYSQVVYHNQIADPGYGTECPGWQHPQFGEWFGYLQGGAEPSWFTVPVAQPVAEPAQPEPAPDLPEYEQTYKDAPSVQVTKQDAFAHDMTGAGEPVNVLAGTSIDIAGTFTDNNTDYIRTVYSKNNNKWYGLPLEAFQEPSGQVPDATILVQVVQTPPVSVLADQTVGTQTDVTPPPKKTLSFGDVLWSILGLLLRPLGKLLNKDK